MSPGAVADRLLDPWLKSFFYHSLLLFKYKLFYHKIVLNHMGNDQMSCGRDEILAEIFSSGAISRRALAGKMHLDVRTVSNYTLLLEEQGFIENRLVSRPKGRPVYEFQPASGRLAFASILLTHSGISGAVKDANGAFLAQCQEENFSTLLEIPTTAARKTTRFFAQLEAAAKTRINALSLVFPRAERFSTFAAELYQEICQRLPIPVFADSPISAHAFACRTAQPEYQKILLLHSGFALEYAFLTEDDTLLEPDSLPQTCKPAIDEIESLRQQVSLSNILDQAAALEQRFFYPWNEMLQSLKSEDPRIRKILLNSEAGIKRIITLLAEKLHPDICILLALPNDLHLTLMPEISSGHFQVPTDKTFIPCFFQHKTQNGLIPLLQAACASAEYRAWKRFFKNAAQQEASQHLDPLYPSDKKFLQHSHSNRKV